MKFTVESLKEEIQKGYRPTYIGFFGNQADKPNERVFSNFYKAPFSVKLQGTNELVTFTCTEQYFMYQKAETFGDTKIMQELLNPNLHPADYKHLGKKVTPYDDAKWNTVRYEKMKNALRHKFTQSKKLRTILLNTRNAVLVETSPFDTIWGIGVGKTARPGQRPINWRDINNWRGQNLLGFALMEIRDELNQKGV